MTARKRRKRTPPARYEVTQKFRDWIAAFGETQLAARLGLTGMAVAHWRIGRARPDPARTQQLVELSAGALTFADIFTQSPLATAAQTSAHPSPTQETTTGGRRRGTTQRR